MIFGSNLSYVYDSDDTSTTALNGIDITVKKGEFVAILGQNGCGKSTLVKHCNALLSLQEGDLRVAGIDTRNEADLWELRRLCGMVFQNPNHQFVSSILEEDIAFGLENYDVPEEAFPVKIQAALTQVGLSGFEQRAPQSLSGGEKQRAALAGVLAVEPEILIFDEVTSMLDPQGQKEILSCIQSLHALEKTILMITHCVDEALLADTVFLMQDGKILASGTPQEILTDRKLLSQAGLLPPIPAQLYHSLADSGVFLPFCPLTNEELVAALEQMKGGVR